MAEPVDPKRPPTQVQGPGTAGFGLHSTRPPLEETAARHEEYPFLAPAQSADEIGRLGPYRVLGVLGRGGMGVVFRAEDTALDRAVALKVILPQYAENADDRARFQREARAQAKVEHDHVAAIYQVGEDRGVLYLAMPLLQGQSLLEALQEQPRPNLREVLRIGREAAEGLAAAHDRGLIHRDVKPANLWLEGPRRRVKVLDFGLARSVPGIDTGDPTLTRTGALLGTPAYMSLEQALGQKVDARTDLFSLGVILYEMTTGVRPYQGDSFGALAVALASEVPPPAAVRNPAIPASLSRLIEKLLSANASDRPATMHAVIEELRRIESEVASRSARPVRKPAARKPSGSGQRVLVVAGVALVAAIVVLLAWPPSPRKVAQTTDLEAPPPATVPEPATPPTLAPEPRLVVPDPPPGPKTSRLPTPPHPMAVPTTADPMVPAVVPPKPKGPVPRGQAEYERGRKYFLGIDGPKDLDRAASLFRASADAGNIDGSFAAAWTSNFNLGKPKHDSVCTYLYQQAAAGEHPLARAVLALAQLDAWDLGNTVDVDLAKGKETLAKVVDDVKALASAGDPVALTILAQMFAGGHGMPVNMDAAFRSQEAAAKAGYAPAQTVLGEAYDPGLGRFSRKPDAAEALKWYRLAAGQGDARAMFLLGEAYRTGRLGDTNPGEAVSWYRKASDSGDVDAMYALAKQYEEGRGVEKDEAEAAYWRRKAADALQFQVDGGSVTAMRRLARAYQNGVGRPKEPREAAPLYEKVLEWRQKSAAAGSAAAMLSLGEAYEAGEGVAKDMSKASDWYRKAASAGSSDARKALERLQAP